MQTSISVPVKGFFSKFGCELHWGVVQLGQDHGAPPAPCRGAQGCTGAHFPQLFCFLSQRAEIWYECLNFDFINIFINHILKKNRCAVVHSGAQGSQSAHFPQLFCLLSQRAEIWYEGLNLDFINFFIHHILKKTGVQWCTVVHRSAQGAQSAHFS